MDYEKKYKEALVNMQELYNSMKYMSSTDALHTTTALERAFPELKELEDEEMRKDIISNLDNMIAYIEDSEGSPKEKKFIINEIKKQKTWLEKQGESKFEQCIQKGDKIVTNEDGTHFNVSQLERVAKKEPNSTWNEEDEENLNQLHKLIVKKAHEEYEIDTEDETLWGKHVILDNWLKSLKDRFQSHWKPNKEQMTYLEAAIEESNGNCILQSLYNDLKKL